MDLRDFGSTLARWWWLAVITVLAALGAGFGLYQAAGATYTANSTVLLLPPKAVLIQAQADKRNYAPNNPLLYLGQLTDSRDVMVRNLSSADVADQLKKKAPDATVAVTADATSGSPLLLVKSTGASEQAALSGVKAVDAMVPGQLKTLQDQMDIQTVQRINSIRITEDSKAAASHKTALELGVVGFVGTLVLGLALIALLDALRNRRRKGTGAREATGTRELVTDDREAGTSSGATSPVTETRVTQPATTRRVNGSKGKGGRA